MDNGIQTKPKLIHSFWTRPLQNNMYGVDRLKHLIGDIWIYALSVEYAHREGFEIDLYTDTLGSLLMSQIPYDSVYKTLDNIPLDVNPRFWAAGKVWALEASDNNSIHIDGDVFIKKANLLEILPNSEYLIQSIEDCPNLLERECNKISPKFYTFCQNHGINMDFGYSYNAGVIGIFNPELKQEYIEKYKKCVIEASRLFSEQLNNPYCTPDLFVEQLLLTTLFQNKQGQLVIPENQTGSLNGFQHLITSHKYSDKIQNKVKETLKKYFPETYNNILKICQKI